MVGLPAVFTGEEVVTRDGEGCTDTGRASGGMTTLNLASSPLAVLSALMALGLETREITGAVTWLCWTVAD